MGTVRIVLRTETKDKDGASPIRLIYSLRGQREYYSTCLKAWPGTFDKEKKVWIGGWSSESQEVLYLNKLASKKYFPQVDFEKFPTSKEVDEINSKLKGLRQSVANIEKLFELNGIPYSKEMVIGELSKKNAPLIKVEAPLDDVYAYIDQYITKHSVTLKKGSLSVYKSLKKHLKDFQRRHNKEITFERLDHTFFTDFRNFLLTPRQELFQSKSIKENRPAYYKAVSLNNTTAAKVLSTLKTFIGYARKSGVVVNDKYKDFKVQRGKGKIIALTNSEFETLFTMDLKKNKRLDQVRDVFCFSCVTGLRYSDLFQLSRVHIYGDEIRLNIKKTSQDHSIPLSPFALDILAKYNDRHKPLPVIANAKMNLYIKELCSLAGINTPVEIVTFKGELRESTVYPKHELVTVHTARKTFCTLSLERGMSAHEVMSVSGHEDFKSFQRYVDVTETRKKTVMAKAWGSGFRKTEVAQL